MLLMPMLPQSTAPPLTQGLGSRSAPTGAKIGAASSRAGRGLIGPARPGGAQLARERLRVGIAGRGEREAPGALPARPPGR